jgi:hypothetical protein
MAQDAGEDVRAKLDRRRREFDAWNHLACSTAIGD